MEGIYPTVMGEIDATHTSNIYRAVIGPLARDPGKPSLESGFAVFLIDLLYPLFDPRVRYQ